jgi:predicted ester cyclase
MHPKSPTEIVRNFWQLFHSRSFDTLCSDVLAPECEFVMPGAPPLRGPAAIRGMFEAYARAFPDFACQAVHAIESGDTYAAETRFTGSHRGALATPHGEIPPTGRQVSWQSADLVRVASGKIVSWHVYHDTVPLLAQLGVAQG